MASGSGSNRWIIALVVVLAIVFLNKYLLIGARLVLGGLLPESGLTSPPVEKMAAPEPTAYFEPTMALEATRAPEVVVENIVTATLEYQDAEITIWHGWDDSQLSIIQPVIEDFERNHPGVSITLVKKEEMEVELQTAAAAGVGPDIIAWWSGVIGNLSGEVLLPLNEIGLYPDGLQTTPMTAAWQAVHYHGQYWGVPISQIGMALIYNKDMLGEDFFLANPYAFLDAARNYQDLHPGENFFCNPGFNFKDAYFLAPIFFSMGTNGYVDQEGNVYLNQSESIEAAELMLAMKDFTSDSLDYGLCQDEFLNGNIPIWWTGSWSLELLDQYGMNYGVLPMGRPFVETFALMPTNSSQNLNNSALTMSIIQALASDELQVELAMNFKNVPASYAALVSDEVSRMPGVYDFAWALEQSVPYIIDKFTELQWDTMQTAYLSFLNGSQSPKDALDAAQISLETQVNIRR